MYARLARPWKAEPKDSTWFDVGGYALMSREPKPSSKQENALGLLTLVIRGHERQTVPSLTVGTIEFFCFAWIRCPRLHRPDRWESCMTRPITCAPLRGSGSPCQLVKKPSCCAHYPWGWQTPEATGHISFCPRLTASIQSEPSGFLPS